MFAFSQIEPTDSGFVQKMPVPLGRYLDASFDQGWHDSMWMSIRRMREIGLAEMDDSPVIQPDELNKRFGSNGLKFDSPTKESVAQIMFDRKEAENTRDYILNNGSAGFFSGRNAGGMAAGMLAQMMNPLDLSVMLMPVVGEAKMIPAITRAGMTRIPVETLSPVRQALARGLITREGIIASRVPAPRLIESVIQGSVGGALMTAPNLIASHQDQNKFTGPEYLLGTALMGVMGGVLHTALSPRETFTELTKTAARSLQRLKPETRTEMARTAVNQMMQDSPVEVRDFVKIDENAIMDRVQQQAKAEHDAVMQSITMEDAWKVIKEKYDEIPVKAAIRAPDGKIYEGAAHFEAAAKMPPELASRYGDAIQFGEMEKIRDFEDGFVTDKGRFVSRDEAGRLMGIDDRYNHLLLENDQALMSEHLHESADPDYLGHDERTYFDNLKELGDSDAQAMKKVRDRRLEVRDRRFRMDPHMQDLAHKLYQTRLNEALSKLRDEPQMLHDAVMREVDQQVAAGKTLSPEDTLKWFVARDPKADSDPALVEEIESLRKQQGKPPKTEEKKPETPEKPEKDKIDVALEQALRHDTGNLTEHLDYSPEDLAMYLELKDKVKPKTMADITSPEFMKNNIAFEKLRNKYNGNPPKQLKK